MKWPEGRAPVSSSTSRRAAANASSLGSTSPLGIDHAPSSFRAHKGPPGWTSNTSSALTRRLNNKSPAACLCAISLCTSGPSPQRDEAKHTGQRCECKDDARRDGLLRRLVRPRPDPAHRDQADEDQDENRGSQTDSGHDGRFWRSGPNTAIVCL